MGHASGPVALQMVKRISAEGVSLVMLMATRVV